MHFHCYATRYSLAVVTLLRSTAQVLAECLRLKRLYLGSEFDNTLCGARSNVVMAYLQAQHFLSLLPLKFRGKVSLPLITDLTTA